LRIGIAYDLVPAPAVPDLSGPDDRYEEFDKPETIDAIAAVLRDEGHEVVRLGDGPALLRRLLDDPPDFVWNLAEGEGIGRCREARVPAVLEMLGIPHSGSDPLTLATALDKDATRRLLAEVVRMPKGLALPPDAPRHRVEGLLANFFDRDGGNYPLILKPALEGSSKGIRSNGLADTAAEAAALFDRLATDYLQPILIEQFISGDEVTVGLVGNGASTEVLGSMRVVPKQATDRFVYSLDVKRDWKRRVEYEAPAKIPDEANDLLAEAALAAYQVLGCRDVARIDFRLKDGLPYFLEANPLPGLAPVTSDLVILAQGVGLSHADLIRRILHAALVRVGLMQPEPVGP
jgi:D-alanine-D-alanine ligase